MNLSNTETLQLNLTHMACKMLHSQARGCFKQNFHYPRYLKRNTVWTTPIASNPTLREQTRATEDSGAGNESLTFSHKYWSIEVGSFDLALIHNCCICSVLAALINELTGFYHMEWQAECDLFYLKTEGSHFFNFFFFERLNLV